MKILLFSLFFYFLILFFLCTYWAKEYHPERRFIIGFLVSFFPHIRLSFGWSIGLALGSGCFKALSLFW